LTTQKLFSLYNTNKQSEQSKTGQNHAIAREGEEQRSG